MSTLTSADPVDALAVLHQDGLQAPRLLTFAITDVCNLACSHCWVEAGAPDTSAHVPSPIVHRIVDQFTELGGTGIRFTGGEPLLHPDCLDFLQRSRANGLTRIILQTNGMLISAVTAAALRALDFSGLSIEISMDGVGPRSHDRVRGDGAFRNACAGIELLTRSGLGTRIVLFFTEMQHNLDDIPGLLKFAEELGVGSVRTGALVRCGRAGDGSGVSAPEPEQYRSLISRFEADEEFRRRYQRIGSTAALQWHQHQSPRTECCTFLENPYLTSHGRLYPCTLCHADEFSVSDVFSQGLVAAISQGVPLWSSLKRISLSRFTALPGCQSCPVQPACAGGCMGRAWGSSGNLMSPDDRCAVRRAVMQNSPL